MQRPPRRWAGMLLLAAGLVLAVGYVGLFERSDMTSLLSGVAAVVCGVAGLAGLASWTAYRVAALLTTGVVLLAVLVTTRLLRPWVLDALDPDQLRTE